jgi:hypothetical protein
MASGLTVKHVQSLPHPCFWMSRAQIIFGGQQHRLEASSRPQTLVRGIRTNHLFFASQEMAERGSVEPGPGGFSFEPLALFGSDLYPFSQPHEFRVRAITNEPDDYRARLWYLRLFLEGDSELFGKANETPIPEVLSSETSETNCGCKQSSPVR